MRSSTPSGALSTLIGLIGFQGPSCIVYGLNIYSMNQEPQTEPSASSNELSSTLTCPRCGHAKKETMPTDACQWFYECEGCREVLRPKPGDCCVYCSYGTVPCPPMQGDASKKGCCGG
jgi:hypothetical protein